MGFSFELLLPSEIIFKIFDYLSVADLLSCGLTCRHWNVISQDKMFLKKIELTFDGIALINTNPDIKIILKSERKYLNISLKSIQFNSGSEDEDFWVRFGCDITSLYMEKCQMTYNKIAIILKHLPNLKILRLDRMEMFEDLYDMSASLNIKDLDCLYGFLDNIETFNILYDAVLTDVVFSKLVELMPNIKYLTVIRYMGTPSVNNDISWDCLKQFIIKQAKKLKGLIVHGWTWTDQAYFDLSLIKMLDLEILEIGVCYYIQEDEQTLCKFLKTQKNLRSLRITSQYLLDTNLVTICNNLQNLETLHFENCNQITGVGISEIYKLNGLKTIVMKCESEAIINGMIKNFVKYKNDRLEKLELNLYCHEQNNNLFIFFKNVCKLYANLTVLKLDMNEINDVVVQSIIENLRWLRTLEMRRCTQVTDYGLTGVCPSTPEVFGKLTTGLSISRLKGLKHLRLFHSEHITEKSFIEIAKCKELQELDLECTLNKLVPEYVNAILRECVSLESLYIRNRDNMMLEDAKKITMNISRLKHFSIV